MQPGGAAVDGPVGRSSASLSDGRRALRRFTITSVVAIGASWICFTWILWDLWSGTVNPFRTSGPLTAYDPGSAYDLQARAILGGHLALPKGSLGLEGFVHQGHTYTYYGIFPSLIRMPVLVFTHSFDGRLTSMSLMAAWLVTAVTGSLLLWRIRILVRGPASLGWAESASYGILLASLLVGSVLVFLAAQTNTYTEDEAWSVALAVASLFALLGVVERPNWPRILAAGIVVLCTNLNRSTTGYTCILAALVIAAWFASGRAGGDRRRWALPVALVGATALIAGSAIDEAKFGLLVGLPVSEQLLYKYFDIGQTNGGHYFSLRFLPSTLQAYLTPWGIRFTSVFPYVTPPAIPNHLIAHTPLFEREPTVSILPSAPLLVGAGLWGTISAFRRGGGPVSTSFRILLVATAGTAASLLIFGWILERYVADFLPFLTLASMIGLVDLWSRLQGRPRRTHTVALGGIGLLALLGFFANIGTAITPAAGWTQTQVDNYLRAARSFSTLTGSPLSGTVSKGTVFPPGMTQGDLFILGDCEGLYIADQTVPTGYFDPQSYWLRAEQAPHTPICRSVQAGAGVAPLTTRLVLPKPGPVSGTHVALDAVASSGQTLTDVSFELTGDRLATPRVLGSGRLSEAGWIYVWNSTTVPDGTYALRSVAADGAGRRAVSPPVAIDVGN